MMQNSFINSETLKKIYYSLICIRKFEEKICELYPKQEIRCPVHLYIGQEAIAAGVCVNLRKDDYVVSNHRNHGHLIAKGVDLKSMFAEIYGKITGCSAGKGGSMHMVSVEDSILGTSSIIGGGIPIAVGMAFASGMKKEKRVTVVFFGDGAVDQGVFFESLNFSSLKKLPVVFICENNFYATNSPQEVRQVNTDIYKIADFFLMPGRCVDGNNVLEIYRESKEAIDKARQGLGPSLIEARTFRWKTHVGPETDIEKGLRQEEEVRVWLKKCPVVTFEEYVLRDNLLTQEDLQEISNIVDAQIKEALDYALSSPYPEEADLNKDVY